MDSPITKSLFSRIGLNTSLQRPVYLQLSDAILLLIKQGKIKSGQKLPPSRSMATLLGINRITVSKAIDELQMQGWLESFVGRGTFVSAHIPESDPKKLASQGVHQPQQIAGFAINMPEHLQNTVFVPHAALHLDDGYPDPKLAPLKSCTAPTVISLHAADSITSLAVTAALPARSFIRTLYRAI
ncbi:GntR family transcriptional regulator [Niabella sp. W65]|nr:GntR family transcriptional regulator [Niabella sp. W65]MCH7365447.1 GntR family transcriptional regulator [Niabella sp. W65]ULT41236.1 GntR family transcriptional regulator [Niabella sp. I65]